MARRKIQPDILHPYPDLGTTTEDASDAALVLMAILFIAAAAIAWFA